MCVFLLTSDLLFSSRVAQAARSAGVPLTVASSSDAVLRHVSESDSPRLLVLDLSAADCDVQRIVAEAHELPSPPTVVAYASHVLGPLLQEARQSGCDLVLTRGQFVSRLDELIQAAIG
ncbi:MAG: hypothetical protein KJ000_21125 [Pirellulaceae bacterium]|nr:hypothetical protein [Pirellulaceae bacterium]